MGIISVLAGGAADRAAEAAALEKLKKGKSPEQKRVIDFFLSADDGGCGCGGCLSRSGSGLTMNEYFKIVNDKVASFDLRNKAIAKIGLDESQISEIPPIPLYSFVYGEDVYYKFENNMVVTNKYSVSWIFFSSEQIYTYQFIFDTTSDNITEETNDYFYRDITCFNTKKNVTERITSSLTSGCLKGGETINKTLYADSRFSIIVPGDSFSVSMTDSPSVEQSIQAAKAMLREKKYSK